MSEPQKGLNLDLFEPNVGHRLMRFYLPLCHQAFII